MACAVATAAQAADFTPRMLPPVEMSRQVVPEGSQAPAPADAEAQIREIERAKRLMRALGEIQKAPEPERSAAALPPPPAPSAAAGAIPAVRSEPSKDLMSAVQMPTAEIREVAGAVGQVARAVGVSADRPAGDAIARSLPVVEESRSSVRPGSEEETRALFDGLMGEVLPWAVTFLVMFGLAYGTYAWMSARATRPPGPGRHGEPRRSRSRRHRETPEDGGSRRRHSSRPTSGR